MPPSDERIVHRLDLVESELRKAQSEYPGESALDRLKFARAMVRVVRSQVALDEHALDDDATIPVLDVELHPSKDYRRG
jgi:hypothetical protein